MLNGNIADTDLYTIGWDFRLLISTKYPGLFWWFVNNKPSPLGKLSPIYKLWVKLIKFTFEFDSDSWNRFDQMAKEEDCVVVITHKNLEPLFEDCKTVLCPSVTFVASLPVQSILSFDVNWKAAAPAKVQYVIVAPKEFKPDPWFVAFIGKHLEGFFK